MLSYLRKKISYDNFLRIFWHWLKGLVAVVSYGFPGAEMVVIGVTGTNGKTTTTHITEHLLRSAGKKVAMLSTVEFRINGKVIPNKSKKTTMSPFKVQKFLRKCVKEKVDYAVIEASSHALHQSRLLGIPFSMAVITNITHEHLDYHKTMEKYKEAKKILFKSVLKTSRKFCCLNRPPTKHGYAFVLNAADRFYHDFSEMNGVKKIAYGLDMGELRAMDVSYSKQGSHFSVRHGHDLVDVDFKMPGSFNVENALAATGVAMSCDIPLKEIKKGLETFAGVEGRMERISSPKGFEVIIDFALTPDALDRLYSTIQESSPARIIGIIGSCGDRDKKKRPVMGRIVADHANVTIVTDEESYSEDPAIIREAILKGAKETGKKMNKEIFMIEDRYKAVEFAIREAKKGDVVVVTGMGSFDTRTMQDGPIKWDDREVVREIIEKN